MNAGTHENDAAASRSSWLRTAGLRQLMSHFRPRFTDRMPRGELRAEATIAAAFLVVAIPLAVLSPHGRNASPAVVLLFIALYAVTSRIEFDVGGGYGPPTQLVLIPMLYALPPGSVPLIVAGGMIVGKLPSLVARARHPDRLVSAVADAWYAIAPAAVFAVAQLTAPRWTDWPVLLAALSAQFVCDFAVNAAREGLRPDDAPKVPVRLFDVVYLVDLCLAPIGFAIAFAAVAHPVASLVSLPLSGLLVVFARDRRARMQTTLELSSAYRGTALLLGDVVEADDAYTGVHSRDVVDLCMAVGPRLRLGEDRLHRLEFTALLHDVGKIAIPKEIINKPGRLTDEERAVIETHTLEGEAMLERVGGMLAEVGRLVRSCHERYDGLGYPDGLAGEAIPIEARIVCCCDAFNAMTTDRPYRAALSLEEALTELRVHRGTQFDPDVVDCLLAMHDDAGHQAAEPSLPDAGELLSAA